MAPCTPYTPRQPPDTSHPNTTSRARFLQGQDSAGQACYGWPGATLRRLGPLFAALEPALDLLVPGSRRRGNNRYCQSLSQVGDKISPALPLLRNT